MWSSGNFIIKQRCQTFTVLTPHILFVIFFGYFDSEDIQLGLVDDVGRFAHHVEGTVGGRESDDVADVVGAGQHHDKTLETDAHAAVRRCAVPERVKEEAETLSGRFHGQADRLEDLLLQILIVDTDRAGKQFITPYTIQILSFNALFHYNLLYFHL